MPFTESIFGPVKEEVWQQLSEQLGAQFVRGGSWHGDKVVARVKEWTVTLDTFEEPATTGGVPYTRLQCPFENADKFSFTIYRKGLLSGLGKLFGMQDIIIGDEAFDRAFVIKGNDVAKVKELFADARVRELLSAQPDAHLAIADFDGVPGGVDELLFRIPGLLDRVDLLRGLYDLFAAVLERMCAIGVALPKAPTVP
jgi:hypothetical protein